MNYIGGSSNGGAALVAALRSEIEYMSYAFVCIAGGSSNGRTAAFEAVNRGSNPCPPAMHGNAHTFYFLITLAISEA